jgi:hypothetical protein
MEFDWRFAAISFAGGIAMSITDERIKSRLMKYLLMNFEAGVLTVIFLLFASRHVVPLQEVLPVMGMMVIAGIMFQFFPIFPLMWWIMDGIGKVLNKLRDRILPHLD